MHGSKKTLVVSLVLSLCVVLFPTPSFSSETPSGVYESTYSDGTRAWISYRDGILQGTYIMFHSNGRPKQIGFYEDGKLEGMILKFYESGALQESATFAEGVLHGMSR